MADGIAEYLSLRGDHIPLLRMIEVGALTPTNEVLLRVSLRCLEMLDHEKLTEERWDALLS